MSFAMRQSGGRATTISGGDSGPNSHLCLSIFVLLCVNPPFGLFALVFSIWSRSIADTDWDGARLRGKIAMFLSVSGIVITVVGAIVFVLIFYTKDS